MNNYLFRGKRKDNCEWVEGYYVKLTDRLTLIPHHYILVQEKEINAITGEPTGYLNTEFSWYEVIPESIGQFIEQTDKNCEKIFDGDIVDILTENEETGVVIQGKGYAFIKSDGFSIDFRNNIDGEDLLIIGNIYDNPEKASFLF